MYALWKLLNEQAANAMCNMEPGCKCIGTMGAAKAASLCVQYLSNAFGYRPLLMNHKGFTMLNLI